MLCFYISHNFVVGRQDNSRSFLYLHDSCNSVIFFFCCTIFNIPFEKKNICRKLYNNKQYVIRTKFIRILRLIWNKVQHIWWQGALKAYYTMLFCVNVILFILLLYWKQKKFRTLYIIRTFFFLKATNQNKFESTSIFL